MAKPKVEHALTGSHTITVLLATAAAGGSSHRSRNGRGSRSSMARFIQRVAFAAVPAEQKVWWQLFELRRSQTSIAARSS